MIIIGDHTKHNKKYKYENYQIQNKDIQKKPRIDFNKTLKMDFTKWLRSTIAIRKNYLKQIGIKNKRHLEIFSKIDFHLLPFDIRNRLQIKEVL